MEKYEPWPVQYFINNVEDEQQYENPPHHQIGEGVIYPDGRRMRVVDIWRVLEDHGAISHGVNVFLEPVEADDDRPAEVAPQYYRP